MSTKTDQAFAEIHLPYFKQGDDIRHAIESTENNVKEGLTSFVNSWRQLADELEKLCGLIGDRHTEIEVEGDTHFIGITGPGDLVNLLIKKSNLVYEDEYDEDDEDEDGFEGDLQGI